MSDKEEYMKKLDDIQRDINWIIQYLIKRDEPIQPPPFMPLPDNLKIYQTNCAKCGMSFEGSTSYYCAKPDCPTFTKTTL